MGDIKYSSTRAPSPEEIQTKVDALGDWITGFTINGVNYGGHYRPIGDERVVKFINKLATLNTQISAVLECGCLEGAHTAMLAQALPKASIYACDIRDENLKKTQLHTELLGISNINIFKDDLDAPKHAFVRSYDAIFCCGILYHLRWPEIFLKDAAKHSPILWLWTVYCAESEATIKEGSLRGRIYSEDIRHPLSAIRKESFFPTLGSLIDLILESGYTHIEIIKKEMTANGTGPAITLCASR